MLIFDRLLVVVVLQITFICWLFMPLTQIYLILSSCNVMADGEPRIHRSVPHWSKENYF